MRGHLDCDVCGNVMTIRKAKDGKGNEGSVAFCTACHTTFGVQTWVISPSDLTPEKIEAKRNINR